MSTAARYATATIPALVILGFFVWFANWIPQAPWEPPQKHEMTSSMTPAQMAAIGETIVRQRGCLACHTIEPGKGVQGGGRGPNWADIAVRRATGVQGGPGDLVKYLAQALYEPGAHLVEGYADIMPPATAAPAKLSYEEVVAVINYLQSLGSKPTVRLGDVPRPAALPGPGEVSPPATTDPAAILTSFGCAACHSMKPEEKRVGPSLDAASIKATASDRGMTAEAYIIESIVKPGAFEKPGFPAGVMPQDFGDKLTAGQLQAVIEYLLLQGGGQ